MDCVLKGWFRPLDTGRTEVRLAHTFEPEEIVEKAGDALGIVQRRAEGDLRDLKETIEVRGIETGGWRGQVSPAFHAAGLRTRFRTTRGSR